MLKASELKILNYLSLSESGEGFISQIARGTGLTRGEVSKSVKTLNKADSSVQGFPAAKRLVNKELKTAGDDLSAARESFKNGNYKWAPVQAYYAMLHAARALLYHKEYREKSHYCLFLAMKEFYASEGILEMRLV